MRRLLAALLASVMLAGAAEARIAVLQASQVRGSDGGTDAASTTESNVALARDLRLLRENLAAMNSVEGRDFVVVPPNIFKTETVRTGLIQWPNGTTEQFDGLIVPSYPGRYRASASTNIYPGIAFDSLTRVRYNGGNDSAGVLVPHLYLLTNATALRNAASDYLSSATAALACSVGVANAAAATNPTIGQGIYMTERPSVRWQPHTYTAGWPITDTAIPGGIRKLLQMSASGYGIIRDGDGLVESQWVDSLPFYDADSETTLVWDRLWANPTSYKATYRAKTQTFCMYYGGGIPFDSLSNAGTDVTYRDANNEGELSVLRFGLAHFDSLVGGLLFRGDAAVRSIVVSHANGRGLRRWTGGIAPGDTAAYYSSLDSLAAWRVPITFGLNVNPDTLSTYARDLIKLKQIGSARFAPYITDGVLDTAASLTATGTSRNGTRWVDVFGRWRNRVLVGPGGVGDSSLYGQLSYLRAFTDSVTGRPTVRVLVPPYDDWSPGVASATNRFYAKANSRIYADSTMYAMARAGFFGVLANGQSPECNLSVGSGVGYTNPRGFIGKQGWFRPKFNGTSTDGTTGIVSYAGATMDPFMVLTHSGSQVGMGKTQQITYTDSTSAKSTGSWNNIHYTLDRANGQFFAARWRNQDDWKDFGTDYNSAFYSAGVGPLWAMDDFQYGVWRGYALKLFASDLSGAAANPARSGLHVIRALQQSFYATNLAAGRTLTRLGYLDEVRP